MDPQLGPLQFDYRAGRGADDAMIFILEMHRHLETPNTSARPLFADLYSAFNSMQPHSPAPTLHQEFVTVSKDACVQLNPQKTKEVIVT